jgi:hypothetical protein
MLLAAACAEERPETTANDGSGVTLPGDDDGGSGDDGIDLDAGDDDDDDGADDDADDGVFDVAGGDEEGDGGEGGLCPCENVLDGIYVLDSNNPAVWFYAPAENQFTMIGALGCSAPLGAVANSMAIDRVGHAWLNYYATNGLGYEGWMYTAPLDDLGNCTDLGYVGDGSWYLMGMGYSVKGADSSCDELFLYNSDQYINYPNFTGGSQLARWDENAGDKVVLGPTEWPVGELTGTGDGRLYAFATVATNESILVQLDKGDGSEVESYPLAGLDITNAFAFAFWGGDVYFFTETSPGSGNSKVTRLDLDENDGGGLTTANANTGLHITGAGVSTCASFEPPG